MLSNMSLSFSKSKWVVKKGGGGSGMKAKLYLQKQKGYQPLAFDGELFACMSPIC